MPMYKLYGGLHLYKQDNVHTNTESVQCISIVHSIYL